MMNYIVKIIIAFICFSNSINAQEFKETITKELSFKNKSSENLIIVDNVYGSIEVEGYNGNTIKIEVDKKIKGLNTRSLEQGKKEIGIKIVEKGNYIYVYLDSPYTVFDIETGRFSHNEHNSRRNYNYLLNFKIKVPMKTNIELKAINNGNIYVKNINATQIVVKNINGAITLDNVSGQTYANALNKDINITYTKNPKDESSYYSLNGDIKIIVKEKLNADISFKTLNGDFYTNFETSKLDSETSLKEIKGRKGIKYKLNSRERFKIGNGGVKLNFDVLNGDVIIKR